MEGEGKEDGSMAINTWLSCPCLEYFLRAALNCFGLSSSSDSDGNQKVVSAEGEKDPKTTTDTSGVISVLSRRPKRPGVNPGRGGQIN
ncbi:hypothetical protein AMTRI_Chr04g252290 [Amborella trichopoda]|uniref:Elicitor peptide 6 n=1 Tax=Amborella trichopoda TaxID=13333 RepID=W1NFS5_AMBTC|nr:hypothetical protein AMTR_s00010p00241380 [Amborella trichopoda]